MNFSEFLKHRRAQKNIKTTKDHYEDLGGEKFLGISLRQFNLIESGKYRPSEELLSKLFAKTSPVDRKALVLAFFRSVFAEDKEANPLVDYIEQYLRPAEVGSGHKGLWASGAKYMNYSEEHLDYLTQNPDALRFHKKILLLEHCPVEDCPLPKEKLKKLKEMGLIEIEKNDIRPSRQAFRVPHYDDSAPKTVAKATDFILKHIELFIAREGSPHQELSYTMQMIPAQAAPKIIDHLKSVKSWIQSMGIRDPGPNDVPFIYVTFAKKIEGKEL